MSKKLAVLKEAWPSGVITRSQVKEFSGGLISPRTLANMDSLGTGPARRFKIGKKVCYYVDDLIEWLEDLIEEVPEK